MIDIVYSIHHLVHSIDDSPNALKKIFESCTDFFGENINTYKIFDKKNEFVFIINIKKDDLTYEDIIECTKIISEFQNNNKYNHDENSIDIWKQKTFFIKKYGIDDY